ncbi:MAG: hypothetical protein M1828_004840 [Chrysothrix sp. TS-e1954]|nr:MAG: hypothetical protein M1828_004840 [Chrysothrix sp. TS-e1954]
MASDSQSFALALQQIGASLTAKTSTTTGSEQWLQTLRKDMEETVVQVENDAVREEGAQGARGGKKRKMEDVLEEEEKSFREGMLGIVDDALRASVEDVRAKKRREKGDAVSATAEQPTTSPADQALAGLARAKAGFDELAKSSFELIAAFEEAEKAIAVAAGAVKDLPANVEHDVAKASEQNMQECEAEYEKVEKRVRRQLRGKKSAWASTWEGMERAFGDVERGLQNKRRRRC